MEKVEEANKIVPENQESSIIADFRAKTNELFHDISEMNPAEIEETIKCHVQAKIDEYGIDATIVDAVIIGSRCRGLERDGCIGGECKKVHEDKTADEDFFLLTLLAVAKEIKTRESTRTLRVVLGVGVPFKRFGKEQAKLVAYLKRRGPHFIEFEEEDYVITIEDVYCFPQCFAAVADCIGNMQGRYVVADIGSWTKDIICIDERKVQPDKCVTIPNSIITLFQEINADVAEATGGRIPESVVQNFILGKDVVIPKEVEKIIVSKMKAFTTDIEGMLDESGFDLAYSNILYVGGGATIMRRFGNARENAAYLEDIRLNAKGYELLATHQMNKR